MNSFSSLSVVSAASVLTAFLLLGACSSDEDKGSTTLDANDSGTDAEQSGSGGKGAGGKPVTGGGAPGSGGSGVNPDAAPSCAQAVALPCDGPEDCPSGKMCCGKWDQEYVEFGCFDSCLAQNPESGNAQWFDLCHTGGACEDPAMQCLTSTYLPASLSRCYDMGSAPDAALSAAASEVHCGDSVCGAGEQCCLRGGLVPYCGPAGEPCSCSGPPAPADAGPDATATPDATTDAATSQPDATSAPDSGTPTADAAPDAPGDAPSSG